MYLVSILSLTVICLALLFVLPRAIANAITQTTAALATASSSSTEALGVAVSKAVESVTMPYASPVQQDGGMLPGQEMPAWVHDEHALDESVDDRDPTDNDSFLADPLYFRPEVALLGAPDNPFGIEGLKLAEPSGASLLNMIPLDELRLDAFRVPDVPRMNGERPAATRQVA
jgi:hypothetical protein